MKGEARMNSIIINACNGFEVPEDDVLAIPCSVPLIDWENKVRVFFRVSVDSNIYGIWDWFSAIVPKDKMVFNLVVEEENSNGAKIKYVRFYLRSLDEGTFVAIASREPNNVVCKSR